MKGLPPSNLWIDLEKTGHNRQAKYELLNLLPENVFDTPKPVKLLSYILGLVEDDDIIVLDFFSGSATTADAVMQQNATDGEKRKYSLQRKPFRIMYLRMVRQKRVLRENLLKIWM